MTTEVFTAVLALVGLVIMIAALFSGLIERSNLPQVAIFLALGAALGPAGLGFVNIGLDSPALRIVATLSLTLVLFTDALTLDLNEVRRAAPLVARMLGPGTLLSVALVALVAWGLLGLPVAAAALVGAALTSTDPVLLRGLLRHKGLPSNVRQALRLESAMNDVVLLPIVLVAMIFLTPGGGADANWAQLFLGLFVLGPGAGVAIGLLAVATLDLVRRRVGIRRDYESLYSLGVAFASYAAAEAVHGSGFLAAFAAGLTITVLDVELCDCFLEYGETTAEMALLFTFVLFGSSLIWSGLTVLTVATALFAVLVLLIRPVVFQLSLLRTRLDMRGRVIIGWFGPRGLSTLLLVLLPVFDRVPGSDYLFAVCSLVVLLSVAVHGGSLTVLGRLAARKSGGAAVAAPAAETVAPEAPPGQPAPEAPALAAATISPAVTSPAAPSPARGAALPLLAARPAVPAPPDGNGASSRERDPDAPFDRERITIGEMRQLQEAGEPVIILDARSERTFEDSDRLAVSALRIDPEQPVRAVQALHPPPPKDAWLVAFCA